MIYIMNTILVRDLCYDVYLNKFKEWCEVHEIQYLPATVDAVVVFLSSLVHSAVSNAVFSSYF